MATCEHCQKAYASNLSLRNHQAKFHDLIRPGRANHPGRPLGARNKKGVKPPKPPLVKRIPPPLKTWEEKSQSQKKRWADYTPEKRQAVADAVREGMNKHMSTLSREERQQRYAIKDQEVAERVYSAGTERLLKYTSDPNNLPGKLMAIRGRFIPRNPGKYKGDPTHIIFRSSWEVKMMRRLDSDPNVIEWSSERIIVPYKDRSTGRLRRYYPDFWMRRFDKKEFMIEVKPLWETIPPVRGTKTEGRFIKECLSYAKNTSKWEAAERYCAERGWAFLKITERELGIR